MDKELFDVKIDKRFFSVVSLSDQSDDKDYWFSRNPIERMRHIEVLRRINYGYRATSRLQRVLEFTEEMPDAYKDISQEVEVVHGAGISKKVAKLRPITVVKGWRLRKF